MIKIKFFADPIGQMEPWLNRTASKGYRLKSVNNFIYSFEKTDQTYSYSTQFIGANPSQENLASVSMLEEKGFRTFRAPLNQGNIIAFGKIRIRPSSRGSGKIATSFGNYNKEILIAESEGQSRLNSLPTNKDVAKTYSDIMNTYTHGLIVLLLLISFAIYTMYGKEFNVLLILSCIILLALPLLYFRLALIANRNYKKYKQET